MKKKILNVIVFAAIAVAVSWNYQQNKQSVELSDLALENIKALAKPENANDHCDNFSNKTCISNGVPYEDMYPAN